MNSKSFLKSLLVLLVVAIFFMGTLTGCNNYELNQWYGNDTNISKDTDRYAIEKSTRTAENGIYAAETTLTGTLKVWEYTATADEILEVPYDFTVSSSSAKLVHISEDKTVTILLEKTKEGSNIASEGTIKVALKKGMNRVKMVGRDAASYIIELNIQKGEFFID